MSEQHDIDKPPLRGDELRHPGIFALWGRSFKGPFGWTAVVAVINSLIAMAAVVFGVIWLVQAETTRGMIGALAVLMAAIAVLMILKIYGWMLILHEALLDRINALERRLTGTNVTR